MRGSIDNSPSQRAGHHAEQESAGECEKEECAHAVLPGGPTSLIACRACVACALFQADFRRTFDLLSAPTPSRWG